MKKSEQNDPGLALSARILANDIIGRISVTKKLEDEVYRDPHSSNRGPPFANGWVDFNLCGSNSPQLAAGSSLM